MGGILIKELGWMGLLGKRTKCWSLDDVLKEHRRVEMDGVLGYEAKVLRLMGPFAKRPQCLD